MNKAKITILRRIENGIIILVTGAKAALKCQRLSKEENKEDMTIPMVMTLNEIPIVQMSPSYCPTCCGLFAAGYGIDNANCSELFEISDYINGGFTDLESLIEVIKPLIGLFEDGVYLIRDTKTFPTDGEGNFFWNVSNKLEYYDAFTDAYYISELYETANIDGVFLYPTQSPDKYDESRVQHYMEMFSQSESHPRAIAYNAMSGMSALLDGHHKACAAARLHRPLDTIMITPGGLGGRLEDLYFGFGYCDENMRINLNEIKGIAKVMCMKIIKNITSKNNTNPVYNAELGEGRFIEREWEDFYKESVKFYPTAEQYAAESVLRYDKVADMTEAEIYKHILKQENPSYYAQMLMHFLYRHNLKQVEPILKKFVNLPVSVETQQVIGTALKYLINFKSKETEELCMKFVIEDTEYLADIAKDYWEDVEES